MAVIYYAAMISHRGLIRIFLNYNYVITPAIAVMPSIQYVIHPNGNSDNDNATIIGLQLSLNF